MRAPSYRACSARHPSPASRSASKRGLRVALGEQHRPRACAAMAASSGAATSAATAVSSSAAARAAATSPAASMISTYAERIRARGQRVGHLVGRPADRGDGRVEHGPG